MNELGIIFGFLSLVLSFIYYYLVPKAGPNVFLGFRFGYSMSDERVWVKSNKYLGKLLFLIGCSMLILALFIEGNHVIGLIFVLSYLMAMLATLLKSKEYAEELLGYLPRDEKEIKPMEPLKVSKRVKMLMVVSYSISIAMIFLIYIYGPSMIPVKFRYGNRPSVYVGKEIFMLIFLTFFTGVYAASWIVEFIGYRYPMFWHAGRLARKWGRDVLLRVVYYTLLINETIGALAMLDIFIYIEYGFHIILNAYGFYMLMVLAALPYILIVYRRLQFREQ